MRLRPLFAVAALPFALAGLVYGCSGGPATEDMCAWLQNPTGTNCVAEFHEDIQDKCGGPDLATVTGAFGSRAMLDMCILTSKGGSVAFDPPLDVTKFPPEKGVNMKILNPDGSDCGTIGYSSLYAFSVLIAAPPPAMGAGGGSSSASSSTGFGGAEESSESHYTQGKIQISYTEGADNSIDVACPAPDKPAADTIASNESHHFNLNQVLSSDPKSGCPGYSQIVPQAILELDPGGVNRNGSLRLRIQYPPELTASGAGGGSTTGGTTGTAGFVTVPPQVVYYFNCSIPAAPLVCANGLKDASETDVDCGGIETTPGCPARCADGQQCVTSCDCDATTDCLIDAKSGMKKCTAPDAGATPKGTCGGIICANLVKDGSEADVDCGGVCPPCADGKTCGKDIDCASGTCTAGKCAQSSCSDMKKNGYETDVDCGGPTCPKCADGKGCVAATDCTSAGCDATMKCTPCADGTQNGKETDIDCGGGTCPVCGPGKVCGVVGDCQMGLSCTNFHCVSCSDMVQDGAETDVDCGGGTCGKCPESKKCFADTDCLLGVCNGVVPAMPPMPAMAGTCNTCMDMLTNGTETDLNCGGATCATCVKGQKCKVNTDCMSMTCVGGICN
jgi:hypothetical protein